jgi:hypothetical protein
VKPNPKEAAVLHKLRTHLSYANVVASVALFAALGGTSYAALTVTGKNIKNSSLTGKDVKNSSLGTRDVKNRSLLAKDFKRGQLPTSGTPGAPGTGPGSPGTPGSAVAFARVNANGTLDPARSKNVASSSKNGALAYYCVRPSVAVRHVSATLDFNGGEISASFTDNFTSCPEGAAIVRTFTSAGNDNGNGANAAFWVTFN